MLELIYFFARFTLLYSQGPLELLLKSSSRLNLIGLTKEKIPRAVAYLEKILLGPGMIFTSFIVAVYKPQIDLI